MVGRAKFYESKGEVGRGKNLAFGSIKASDFLLKLMSMGVG